MTRGTTPTFNVTIDDISDLSGYTAQVVIAQGSVVITKTYDQGTLTDHIECTLTQEETLRFVHTRPAYLQVRLRNTGGTVQASDRVKVTVMPILTEAVMRDD